jgi:hypothetical protein
VQRVWPRTGLPDRVGARQKTVRAELGAVGRGGAAWQRSPRPRPHPRPGCGPAEDPTGLSPGRYGACVAEEPTTAPTSRSPTGTAQCLRVRLDGE